MRLLLAEDEKSLSRALVTILEKNRYTVDPVYNGVDALYYLQHAEYDGAILDIMMPGLDGLSVLREIRKTNRTLPVLILTAKNEIEDRVEGLDSGADSYLGKPFDTKELLARLRAMLRRVEPIAKPVLTFGDLSLDRNSFILTGPKGQTRLSNKEFQMMELMMTSPEWVISTETFMERIWGLDSSAEINVVWTYISVLRNNIDDLSDRVRIKSVRNSGYSLELKGVSEAS